MKLKLINGRSYSAKGVSVTTEKPFFETADNKLADALVKSGHFIAVSENNSSGNNTANSGGGKETPLEKMTAKQLDEYAKEKGIDLSGLTKNADKLAKIQQVLAELNAGGGINSLNEVQYGEV